MNRPDDRKNPSLSLAQKKQLLLEKRLQRKTLAKPKAQSSLPQRPTDCKPLASLGQKRIWLLDELSGETPSFNVTSSFYIASKVDHTALEIALNKVVQRHEVLRSSYSFEESELLQHNEASLHLSIKQVRCDSGTTIEEAAQSFVRQPFKLDKTPLLRLALFSESDKRHILSMAIHDIIFDKWSIKLFWKEFSAFYEEAIRGTRPNIPELPVQYSDFSYWQRKWLDKGTAESQLAYWKEKLKNPPPPIPFATDRPYSDEIMDCGALERSTLSADTTVKLRDLAASQDASLFMTLLLGFNILLSKYTNTQDLLVSSPVANRRKRETADLLGFFLNTIVIRTDLSDDPTVLEALAQIGKTSLEALENQDLPPDVIVDAIKPRRIAGRHPLFQTMFVFQREDEGKPRLHLYDCDVSPTFIDTQTSKFDLCLFVAEAPEGMDTIAEYRTDIFDTGTIKSLLNHYSHLMDDLVQNPNKRISELSLLNNKDRSALLQSGSKAIPLTNTDLVHEQISRYASVDPSKIALSFPNQDDVTYFTLEKNVQALAKKLVAIGANSKAPIAIYMDPSSTAIIALLATLRSGAHYVTLDPTYPASRLKTILEDAQPTAIITGQKYVSSLSRTTQISLIDPENFDPSPETHLPSIKADSLAYLIYTSGSTGTPKGVMVTHDNLRYSTFARHHFYTDHPDRFLLLSSLSFDSSVAGIFWTLTAGKTLIILKPGDQQDPSSIRKTILEKQVTTLLCIPGLYREIIDAEAMPANALRTVIVAGEACHSNLVDKHYQSLGNCDLYNEYGPTEATVWSTATKLEKNENVTIGYAIPNYLTYVLSENRSLLPIGIPGELYIGGPGIAKGYLNNPVKTEEKFIALTLPDTPSLRMYKTGDRVRRLPNDSLEFLGRLDDQVKIRGYRIELGEVESALALEPNISECVVRALEELIDNRHTTRLIAYLKVRDHSEFNVRKLKQVLSGRLPAHAIPSQFVALENIPKLGNGKVDKNALPTPEREFNQHSELVVPANPTEEALVRIWKQVLGLPQVSTEDDFFDLGGTSLQAIRLVSKIKDAFQTKLSTGALLEAPTIIQLAQQLDSENSQSTPSNLITLKSGGDRTPVFLVPSGGLEILFYHPLAKHIDNNIPVYGIEPIGFKLNETPLATVEKMAEHYIKEIRRVLTNGPFTLLGHCFGATIAFEMAKQLRSLSIDVPIIISLDGQAPRQEGYTEPKGPSLWDKIKSPNLILDDLRSLSGHPIRNIRESRIMKSENIDKITKLLIKRTGRIVRKAFVEYRATPYSHEILAFNCAESCNSARHTESAWKESAPKTTMLTINCQHIDILKEPFVQQIASEVNKKLDCI